MSSFGSVDLSHRKRKRRRRQDKPAIAARLVLDDHVKGDVGILSEDLFADLFPNLQTDPARDDEPVALPDIVHVAIAPWAPNPSSDSTNWTIVPVTKSTALAHSTVQFSPSSLALQSFATYLQQVAPSKLSSHSRSGIEILVLDVLALSLDTVFVSLEGELAKRLEDGEGTFFREHPSSRDLKGKGAAADSSPEDRLTASLRVALGTLKVVHTGDLFPLPLPPHPITHVPPNPGKVTLCEPVGQGVLSPHTRIIVARGRLPSTANGRVSSRIPPAQKLKGVAEDDEDTATDQFYSAAEERYKTENDTPADDVTSTTETEESELSSAELDDLSDDSMDDMISLQTPTLPATNASGVSTLQPGTPMTLGRGRKTNGIATPASVFSSFTATTARPDRPRGRLFKAQGLIRPIPTELLHPKVVPEDDEEARVYVDISNLARIGCFSGDWVRLEAAEEPPANGFGHFGLGSFGQVDHEEPNWRPVRIFSLPEGYSHRPVTRIPSARHDGRRLSFFESQIQKPTSPAAFASPVLLANLDSPSYLRISPLKRSPQLGKGPQLKLTGASLPPYAREVILQQVRTPVAVERDVQSAVMAGLKLYFEKKLRIVRSGDLIAVPIDTQLGKTLHDVSTGSDGVAIEDILALAGASKSGTGRSMKFDEVAWFKVTHIAPVKVERPEEDHWEDPWGSVACIEISTTHLEQSGSLTSRIPGIKDSNWRFYLGLKEPPRRPSDPTPTAVLEPEQRHISALRRRLRELMAAATSQRAIHLKLPPLAVLLTSTQRNIGKTAVARDACLDIGLHTFVLDAYDIVNDAGSGGSDMKTEGFLKVRAERAMSCGPDSCALLIRHIEALTADRMVSSLKEILADARVLIATTTEVDKVPDGVRGLFTHELDMTAPDEGEREGILRNIIDDRGISLDPEVDLGSVALKTAALVAGDLVDVVERALVAQRVRLEKLSSTAIADGQAVTVRDVQLAGGPAARSLTAADFEVAVEAARKNFADAIGAPKIPNVTWDDVGGLNNVKDAVKETIQLPLERPELFAKGMKKRSGILFYGPPGTGKTLLAKAIATEYSLNFFSVKGPELLNMYIGESEANVRRVFQRARDARPCVVFFDELDSVAPKRGNQGDSGGVMDRIVSQLLAELDGMSGGEDTGGGVFVIGATNRPDLLDPALLRPGRFDKMLYLGVSDTHEKQLTIMEALTRKFTLHPTISLRAVAERLPFTYTGADFYALCSDAMLKAVTRQAARVDAKIRAMNAAGPPHQQVSTAYFFDHYASPEDVAVVVDGHDFADAQRELVPSVSAGELAHYERVRATFEGGRDTANGHGNGNGNGGQAQRRPSALLDRRSASSASRTSAKGKGKAVSGKGKGKAVALDSSDEFSDDYGPGFDGGISSKAKGKGKAVAGFQDGTASDDEGLYD
ncbi:Peroxisomal biogenesis factor 6 [Pleurostoma richardsiae]|uniref:Peroxisomal ATPase PEX6 n=1 Tax=Pleurostoma richardsiae TaxID=41990 RepID=A0AA38VXI2_9PEZI|nr:Peroxisomal biogenesis factor 6 [Pleurostoma richardsiae]